jgi:hypothetical protein
MIGGPWRSLLLPLKALWSPGTALDEARSCRPAWAVAGLVVLTAALGVAGLPRLLALLGASLAPAGNPVVDAHLAALHRGLARYLVADRLLLPPPYLIGGLLLAAVAAPVLAGRGIGLRAIAGALVVGAAPLLIQRLGELGAVVVAPGGALAAGDVARLPARFNVGLAGALALAGVTSTGWLSVVAEAANAVGVWVFVLWGWGLARLDRGASVASTPDPAPRWPFVLAAAAYGAGYAVYGALFPYYLMLVMGAP